MSMDWFSRENLKPKPWFLPSNIGLLANGELAAGELKMVFLCGNGEQNSYVCLKNQQNQPVIETNPMANLNIMFIYIYIYAA